MYRFDAIVHFRKAEQLHEKPRGQMSDLPLKTKKAEPTAIIVTDFQHWS